MRFLKLIVVVLMAFAVLGCGDNKKDLMMRAMSRPRDNDDSEEENQPAIANNPPALTANAGDRASATQANVPLTNQNPTAASSGSPQANVPAANQTGANTTNSNQGTAVASDATGLVPAPIDTRRPAEPLSDFERQKRSADNIKKIGTALANFTGTNKRFPARGIATRSGIVVLSWRVELLPYLGYQDLYNQFDKNQPWDSPKNMALLDRIPDCYVSPERFDTNTNYLGISGASYVFQDQQLRLSRIEDGPENTLAVLEVNDEYAVPWTSPMDYSPEPNNTSMAIGDLRPEGTYGLWANGWATLIKNSVSDDQLHRAFTYESGDGLQAGQIHSALNIQDSKGAFVAAPKPSTDLSSNVPAVGSRPNAMEASPARSDSSSLGVSGRGSARGEQLPRLETPTRAAIADATARVEMLFEERIKQAVNREQIGEMAREMLVSAESMRDDPAGAYALQRTAVDVAIKAGNLDLLRSALDNHVSMFEVDAIALHADSLLKFGKENGGVLADFVDGREYVKSVLPVIYGLLIEDSYESTDQLIQFALMYESRGGKREFIADLNRMKTQLVSARNFFRRTGDALGQLRENPEDGAAAFAVGRYVTFIKGDWDSGLPVLAMSDNARLAQMARADIATKGASAEQVLSTADSWWSLGEETGNDLFKGACRERAAHWYEIAMQSLPDSLSKLHAKSRLEEYTKASSGSPVASVEVLAQGLGIDVRLQLAAIKDPQVAIAANNNDDEEDD